MNNISVDCIIGIDPGKGGGIAVWRPNHKTQAIKMPENLMDLKEWFDYMQDISVPIVFIEKLQLRTTDMTDNPGKVFRINKLLADFEKLKTIMTICNIPFVLVNPMKWQSELKLRIKGEIKEVRKNRYRSIAGNKYPEVKATLWNADALLIMHFGRYMLKNNLNWVMANTPINLHDKLF